MGKTVWMTLICGSLLVLVGYLASLIFMEPPQSKPARDPFEALMDAPPETLHFAAETGRGELKEGQSKGVLSQPLAAQQIPKDDSADSIIHSALFRGTESVEANAQDPEKSHAQTEEQLGNIQKELAQLPGGPESAPARTVLLHTASTLNLDEREADQVHELAMNELLQGQAPSNSSSFSYFLPVLAHEVALKTALDSSEALSITIDGLVVQQDPGIRYSLVRQFVSRYPSLEYQLREQLYMRNIQTESLDPAPSRN